ncbi:MAG: hypothetical protein HY723_06035 [Chloroflexi bacterium]|nr:hypothetical protein [Chloroflexota bacterium]
MNPGLLFAALPVLGVVMGLAGARYRRLPLLAACFVAAAYGVYLASAGVWAATCWDCRVGVSQTRNDILLVSAVFFGLVAFATLVGVALGARLVVVLRQLSRTIGELRHGGGEQA